MEDSLSLPLHLCHVHKLATIFNRSQALFHSIALLLLIHYRVSFILSHLSTTRAVPLLLWLIVFGAELLISFIWLLGAAFRWRLVSRTVFPERLPEDDKLPAIDVFICTADPSKEPTVEVMNTVLSAMALDYPPEKLHVYLSDDGGSSLTLHGMKEAWSFAKEWLPFCTRYGIKTRCPKAYFQAEENDARSTEFVVESQRIKVKYELFKESVKRAREDGGNQEMRRDHSPEVEVIQGNFSDEVKMPSLVYVSREKRPDRLHHFKAGALNALLRVSGILSNSPYILVLDCDMYCNDPTSARQAMCLHIDPKSPPSLAFVQFPQRFHTISNNDIYDSKLRSLFKTQWWGFDGLEGPCISGTGLYIKRRSLYVASVDKKDDDLMVLGPSFGQSSEFVNSLGQNYMPNLVDKDAILQEIKLVASCDYEVNTLWGEDVGFMYFSVVEDYFTGLTLHCRGWISAFLDPPRPQFLGSGTTNLNDLLIQGTRWSSGLVEVGISRFCPLLYGASRMGFLESLCYGELALHSFYCFPLLCFATIPQLCLLNGVALYPEVSNPYFMVFLFIFLSSGLRHLYEVLYCGDSVQTWLNEGRIWMMKSVTCYPYGCLDAIMKRIGVREASFLPTNKVADEEQVELYQMGKFDFRTSNSLLAPILTLVILNLVCFGGGVGRAILKGGGGGEDKLVLQILLSSYVVAMSYPIIEGMVLRKDKGRVPLHATLLSAAFSGILISLGCAFCYR